MQINKILFLLLFPQVAGLSRFFVLYKTIKPFKFTIKLFRKLSKITTELKLEIYSKGVFHFFMIEAREENRKTFSSI